MIISRWVIGFVIGCNWFGVLTSHAETPSESLQGLKAYALIVGSNRGGSGQEDLRFAEGDAQRVMEVLTELGGYSPEDIVKLTTPSADELRLALSDMFERLKILKDSQIESTFLFYYSGHARASALSLSGEEVDLVDLRQKLQSMPATMTIAILDACQAGAISGVKGVEPAADFSFNSVSDLHTAGIAVMASSSGSELSQESSSLGSSYFTHHLVVGLRGAADSNQDGRVTLSEAYQYAYNHTLVATAQTAVGKQHVTLETELKGKGETILTRPAQAQSALHLPAKLSGEILLHFRAAEMVMAELDKTEGDMVRLALPSGEYRAIVKTGQDVFQCDLLLQDSKSVELQLNECIKVKAEEMQAKGPESIWHEHWALELSVGGIFSVEDGYNQRLEDFGFAQEGGIGNSIGFSVALSYGFNQYLSLLMGWTQLDSGSYNREVYDLNNQQKNQTFQWAAHGIGVYARGTLPLLNGWLNPYVQAGGGLTWGTTEYTDPLETPEVVDNQLFWGFQLGVAAGIQFMPWKHLGAFAQASYVFAPTIENLLGDSHDSGGPGIWLGIRGAI